MKKIAYLFLGSVTIWLCASLGMLLFAEYFIYEPFHYQDAKAHYSYHQDFVKNKKGEKLEFWFKENPNSNEVILYLHGTGGRNPSYVDQLSKYANVLSPTYPGFGESEGSPNTESINETAVLAISYLKDKGFNDPEITVWGQSLGGSPALYLATLSADFKKVVLINTFDSIKKMGERKYGPLAFFADPIHNSQQYAKKAKAKIRQFHVIEDEVVPYIAGVNLYRDIASPDKRFISLEEGTHSDFDVWVTMFVEDVFSKETHHAQLTQ